MADDEIGLGEVGEGVGVANSDGLETRSFGRLDSLHGIFDHGNVFGAATMEASPEKLLPGQ